MKNFIIIIFVFIAFKVEAQYFSDDGRFSVVEKNGCAPFNIQVTAPECDGSISCTAILGNGVFAGFNNGDVLPYPTAGNFRLQIVFGTSGTGNLDLQVFPNVQPTFEIFACQGNKVLVKIPDTNYDQYIINYNDASPLITVPKGSLAKDIHIFLAAGNKTITVRGKNLSSADNCTPGATQTINVTPSLQQASISQLEVMDASKIKLDYNNPPASNQLNTQYKLEIAPNSSSAFQQLQTLYNTTTTTIASLSTDNNFYCFRMSTFDACTNIPVPASYSNTICSANFDLNIVSDANKMTWVTYSTAGSNVTDFSIAKIVDLVPFASIPKSASDNSHIDDGVNITCNTDYCYQLTTNYIGGSKSISLLKCGTSFSDGIPFAIEDISSEVSETGVALTWLQDPAFTSNEYSINKSTSGNFRFLANTTTPTYNDETYLTESFSCYKISYIDACLNSSPFGVEACPIRLSGSLQPNNDISLTWSDYTGWKNGVKNYFVQKFNSQGQPIGAAIDNGLMTTYVDPEDFIDQTYTYVITAIANDVGVSQSASNTITLTKEPYLNYPTGFSPRSNVLKNQIFKVFGQYVSSFEMRIFNRWGQEMFYTNNFDNGWDGTYNGNLMPEGTYVFTAQIIDREGVKSNRSGSLVLLKK